MFIKNSDRRKSALEILKYGVAGLANTAVAAATYSALITFTNTPYFIANLVAVILSVVTGYFLSRYFVFRHVNSPVAGSKWRYLCVMGLQYVCGTAIIGCLVSLHVGEISAYVVALPVMIALSFSLQRAWVFAAQKNREKSSK